jgi:hypothetical protein
MGLASGNVWGLGGGSVTALARVNLRFHGEKFRLGSGTESASNDAIGRKTPGRHDTPVVRRGSGGRAMHDKSVVPPWFFPALEPRGRRVVLVMKLLQ